MQRRIGVSGTIARMALGGWLAGSVALGHLAGPFRPLPWIVGLIVFPAVLLGAHSFRIRSNPQRLMVTGLAASSIHLLLFFGMLSIEAYIPQLWFLADAALLYYGASMLLAAMRGERDCEILALSNWVLQRDDRLGCPVFEPFDRLDVYRSRVSVPPVTNNAPEQSA